mmetsp:Transcript_85735/g.216226  ORF Transcript_85735/g.216226 Transcript_85735/m.216226 type:complete len:299 (+) Transcript_85735:960-1856(+)
MLNSACRLSLRALLSRRSLVTRSRSARRASSSLINVCCSASKVVCLDLATSSSSLRCAHCCLHSSNLLSTSAAPAKSTALPKTLAGLVSTGRFDDAASRHRRAKPSSSIHLASPEEKQLRGWHVASHRSRSACSRAQEPEKEVAARIQRRRRLTMVGLGYGRPRRGVAAAWERMIKLEGTQATHTLTWTYCPLAATKTSASSARVVSVVTTAPAAALASLALLWRAEAPGAKRETAPEESKKTTISSQFQLEKHCHRSRAHASAMAETRPSTLTTVQASKSVLSGSRPRPDMGNSRTS